MAPCNDLGSDWPSLLKGGASQSGTSRVLGGRTIGRLGDIMCDPYRTCGGDEKCGFPGLASKPMAMIWWFGPQNHCDEFLVWASKPSGRRFISLCLKTDGRMKTVWGHASTSSDLLHREASRARVSQFCFKLVKEQRWLVHLASSWRSHGSEAKDSWFDGVGCGTVEVGPNYPSLDVIFFLAHRDILVFWLSL
jgi:hypothetical protein